MGTRCERCATVWMPPRPVCGNDGNITEWVELSQHGTLAASALSTHGTGLEAMEPLALGYVALEGATTLLLQQIRNFQSPEDLFPGLAVKVVWSQAPVAHPMETFWFEPC